MPSRRAWRMPFGTVVQTLPVFGGTKRPALVSHIGDYRSWTFRRLVISPWYPLTGDT
jgi:hypothetical protein